MQRSVALHPVEELLKITDIAVDFSSVDSFGELSARLRSFTLAFLDDVVERVSDLVTGRIDLDISLLVVAAVSDCNTQRSACG